MFPNDIRMEAPLKAGSDRNGTTAFRSAVADSPWDHILGVRGARVEAWLIEGGH